MSKPEWGTKRQCLSCGAKFYDFSKTPIICPSCETVFEAAAPKPKAVSKEKASPKKAAPAKPAAEADDDDDLLEDNAVGDDGLMEDASDLGEDDDDMAEVMEHMETEVEDT